MLMQRYNNFMLTTIFSCGFRYFCNYEKDIDIFGFLCRDGAA